MPQPYDVKNFFKYLGYPGGDQPYWSKDLRTLSVYCRGDAANLAALLEPTPFEPADDRFVVQIADFGNATPGAFYDSGIVIPVRYKGTTAVTYFFEFEDQPWSVAFGREVWGYPKQYAEIELTDDEDGARGTVTRAGSQIFRIAMSAREGHSADAWSDMRLYPHLQVHALPEANGPGFKTFEIISRDTSKDFVLRHKSFGPAEVDLSPALSVNGVELELVEVLGGEYSVGDYACTVENGISTVIDDLLADPAAQDTRAAATP
ncbi:acetoacetate decarboxylase family protein [Streptomyces sp. SHP 1-2]|uniref:acetoacetate decarboxylase family protein n=1 Tax=Streptomyces sp. SHP 1-2 TaxID=2769489 RepID=UPI0022384042|nr:acetoacetate decarboxylase family protein [Streptomyces sp. SHP 1-2]MCW5251371.1 acetoacetate decarboxylase family protein [Streptomyces sp. SHP 1-2]